MFCEKCGKQIAENARFCENCGNSINEIRQEQVDNQDNSDTNQPNTSQNPEINNYATAANNATVRKSISKKAMIIISSVAAAVVLALILLITNFGCINVKKYLIKEDALIEKEILTGINGHGTLSENIFDYDELEKLLEEKRKKKTDNNLSIESIYGAFSSYVSASDFVSVEIDKTEALSNGDVVNITINVDKDALKKIGIKTFGGKKVKAKYKISGLEEGTLIDPYKYIDIEYKGVDGNASPEIIIKDDEIKPIDGFKFENVYKRISIYNNGKNVGEISYSFDGDYTKISNGDEVTVLAYCNVDMKKWKLALSSEEKKYTVPELGVYVKDVSKIDSAFLENLKTEMFNEYDPYDASIKEKLVFFKAYLVTPKNETISSYYSKFNNRIYFVYSFTETTKNFFGEYTSCKCVATYCDNIIADSKGVRSTENCDKSYTSSTSYNTVEEYVESLKSENYDVQEITVQ